MLVYSYHPDNGFRFSISLIILKWYVNKTLMGEKTNLKKEKKKGEDIIEEYFKDLLLWHLIKRASCIVHIIKSINLIKN